MLEFTPIASSSAGCCYRLSGGGASAPLLIDAGVRYEVIQKALDFKVTQLAGCLISHAHGDHIKAAGDLMAAGVNCWASKETWAAPIRGMRIHRAYAIEPRQEVLVGDWRVKAFEAVHDVPGTLGFVIGSPSGHRLLYLTDSAYSLYRFDGLTHVCVECNYSTELIKENAISGTISGDRFKRTFRTHMSLERLIEMLKANDLSKVEEIHLLHLSSENSDAEGFKRAVEAATGIPTYIAAERAVLI